MKRKIGIILAFGFFSVFQAMGWPPSTKTNISCDTNVKFPVEVRGAQLYCDGQPMDGTYGRFLKLVDTTGKPTSFGIKIFFKSDPSLVNSEIEEIEFGRRHNLPVPGYISSFNQGGKDRSNYIVKEMVSGSEVELLFMLGCFLSNDSLLPDLQRDQCRSFSNATGKELLGKLRDFLVIVRDADAGFKREGKFIFDLHSRNIMWDRGKRKMILVDYGLNSKRNPDDEKQSSIKKFEELYNRKLFIPEGIDERYYCLQQVEVENMLKEFITIRKPVDPASCR